MNQDQPEMTLEESVKEVMQTLPPIIRTYLSQGKYTEVAKSLMTKYSLRIDQGGVLEREIMLLLMGIENPDEFTQSLATDASLNAQTISSIVQDINAQIFVPLREAEMKNGGVKTSQSTKSAEPIKRAPPQSYYTAPPQSPRYSELQTKMVPTRPAQMPLNTGRSSPSASKIAPLPPKVVLPRAAVSVSTPVKPIEDRSKLLEDHEEPHIEFKKASAPPTPHYIVHPPLPSATPKPSAPPTPQRIDTSHTPVNVPPRESKNLLSPNAPHAIPAGARASVASFPRIPSEIPMPEETPIVLKTTSPSEPNLSAKVPVQEPPKPAAIPIKHYSSDPYREPIDEK